MSSSSGAFRISRNDDPAIWVRARRHPVRYGGTVASLVIGRATGSEVYNADGRATSISPRAR